MSPRVPAALDEAAGWAWRLVIIGLAVVGGLLAMSRLRLVLVPIAVGFLLATVLARPALWLTRRGLPRWAGTALAMIGFLLLLAGAGRLIVTPLVDDASELGDSLQEASDDIERWLITGPLRLERQQVEDGRERIESGLSDAFASDGQLVDTAVLVGEALAGGVLALVISFFLVKDGEFLQRWALGLFPEVHRERAGRVGNAAWTTLGHYVIGAALLGVIEAVVIGATMAIVGSKVVVPVMVLTFLAAFFPVVGAMIAGVIAVLVTLAAGGVAAAVIVAVVAVLVQQFDNDLLGPWIFGRALRMHPLAVLVAVTAGGALGGIGGALVAVPATAIVVNAYAAARQVSDDVEDVEDVEVVAVEVAEEDS